MKHDTRTLVIKAQQKNAFALRVLYENSVKQMFNLSYRLTNNYADAQDAVQEGYIAAFSNINTLKEPTKFYAWLKRIIVNKSLAISKSRIDFANIEQLEIAEVTERYYEDFPAPELYKAIQSLPNGCREIFTLYLLEDYKHREISEMLGISIPTSKSQYRYALKLLRNTLKKYKNEAV